jgi:hypothetical protein
LEGGLHEEDDVEARGVVRGEIRGDEEETGVKREEVCEGVRFSCFWERGLGCGFGVGGGC